MKIPEEGQLVQVRNRHYVVANVSESANDGSPQHKVSLECLEDDALGDELQVIWQREIAPQVYDTSPIPRPDGWDPLPLFEAYTDALRWSANSVIAGPRISAPFYGAIEIEPYQLVPVVRALRMNRVSLLLADDVGLGKTIEAGLVAQELVRRHRARRIMIVCPASLQRQWQEEMREKFNLNFRILDRTEIERLRREFGIHTNPWRSHPRIITSMDFIKREQPLRGFREALQRKDSPGLRDWDLLILDEAHNCAPAGRQSYQRDSDRTRMLREIKDSFEHRLFLTATPHNGFTTSFTGLLEMLDPLRFSRAMPLNKKALKNIMVRRLKDQVLDDLGSQRFAHREVEPLPELELPESERSAHDLLDKYIKSRMHRAQSDRITAVRFALTILKKRLLSSPEAFYLSLQTHVQTLEEQAEGDIALAKRMKERAEQDFDDDDEKAEVEAAALQEATRLFSNLTDDEKDWLKELIGIADELRQSPDTKARALADWVGGRLRDRGDWNTERLLVFTEYRDTLRYLREIFDDKGWTDRILMMSGGMTMADRQSVNEAFQTPPSQEPVRILLGTDAASEGLNLQKHCRYLIHYEIPWNPNRMEQRNGRIDRHGQNADVVYCHHFVYADDEDRRFLEVVVDKVRTQRADLGAVGDVIAEEVEKAMLRESTRIQEPTERRERIEQELQKDTELKRRIHEIRESLDQTRNEWKLRPGQMAQMLDQALTLAGGDGLETIENGDLAGRAYRLRALPATWRHLSQHLRNESGDRLAITFDHNLARDRKDVRLLHLGHPIMQRAIALFRSCMWEQFAPDRPDLQRCSYKIVPDNVTKSPALITFARLAAVGENGRILHESLIPLGRRISQRDLFEIEPDAVARLLDAEGEHRPISREIAERLQGLFPSHQQQIEEMVEELRKEQAERAAGHLQRRAQSARKETRELIDQRIKEIEQELEKAREELADAQMRLIDEREGETKESINWMEMRLDQLQRDRETEPDAAARRFTLSSVRIFPVGILYVLPESVVEG